MLSQEWIRVEKAFYIYRAVHRIMEGDCQMEHGPLPVTIEPFWGQKYTVTNHMYKEFLKESGYEPRDRRGYLRHWKNGSYRPGEEDDPVVWVSKEDAEAYADFYGWKLPTEAQWQYMAAGPEKYRWPWGRKKDLRRANVYGSRLEPADSHPEGASPFGFMNMCGNVWELTRGTIEDNSGAGAHRFIVLRGGSFYSGGHYWHVQGGAVPNDSHLKVHLLGGAMNRYGTVGFRCVREEK